MQNLSISVKDPFVLLLQLGPFFYEIDFFYASINVRLEGTSWVIKARQPSNYYKQSHHIISCTEIDWTVFYKQFHFYSHYISEDAVQNLSNLMFEDFLLSSNLLQVLWLVKCI